MISNIISSLILCITSCFGWFEDLLSSLGAASFLLGFISIFLCYRFLIAPLFGGSGRSDTVKKGKKVK